MDRRGFNRYAALSLLAGASGILGVSRVAAAPQPVAPFNILPLQITGVTNTVGGLVAAGTLGNTPFTAPLTVTPGAVVNATTQILNLQLGPINLNLLGLTVATSPICLAVTAQQGTGNLLGNLLFSLANALNGASLATVLSGLTSAQLANLTSGLTNLLNAALGPITSSAAFAGASCPVLHLALGPVNLNLLGLVVHLDNCANGPVTVDITAVPGAGNLLGNLICNLAHLLDTQASLNAIATRLTQIADTILHLIA